MRDGFESASTHEAVELPAGVAALHTALAKVDREPRVPETAPERASATEALADQAAARLDALLQNIEVLNKRRPRM